MKSVREVLVAARALIDTPEKWTKGSMGRTASGACVVASHRDACRWCAIGAVIRVDGSVGYRAWDALDAASGSAAPMFNDAPSTTHADVMNLFDRAIAACPEAADAHA